MSDYNYVRSAKVAALSQLVHNWGIGREQVARIEMRAWVAGRNTAQETRFSFGRDQGGYIHMDESPGRDVREKL